MDNIHENDLVALLVDQPEAGLHRGDVGTVIQVFQSDLRSSGRIHYRICRRNREGPRRN